LIILGFLWFFIIGMVVDNAFFVIAAKDKSIHCDSGNILLYYKPKKQKMIIVSFQDDLYMYERTAIAIDGKIYWRQDLNDNLWVEWRYNEKTNKISIKANGIDTEDKDIDYKKTLQYDCVMHTIIGS